MPEKQPDTRQEVDPDVALLLGLRPPDATSLPDEDEDNIVAVAEGVPGVTEVISRIVVTTLSGSESTAGTETDTPQGERR